MSLSKLYLSTPEIVKLGQTHTHLWTRQITPSTDLETYPTTAEVGVFAPRLLSGRYPLKLKLNLFAIPLLLMLDIEYGLGWDTNSFTSDLDLEGLSIFQAISKPSQLRYGLFDGILFLYISILFLGHQHASLSMYVNNGYLKHPSFLWLCLSVFGKYSDIEQKYSHVFEKSMFFELAGREC